jgi:hypothetical protein
MSIMIEINRKLYLQKGTNIKNDNYCHVKALIKEYLKLVRESFLE